MKAKLFTLVKQDLHPDADAEHRHTLASGPPQRRDQSTLFGVLHHVAERADARQKQPGRRRDNGGSALTV